MHTFILYSVLFLALTASPSTLCNGLMRKLQSETPLNLTCRKTTNFGFCAFVLKSDPRSLGASVDGLAHISLDKLKDYAEKTLSYVQNLEKSCSGKEKMVATTCINYYGIAVNSNVPTTVRHLNGKDYAGAINAASAAVTDEAACQGAIEKNPSSKWEMQSEKNGYIRDLSILAPDLINLLK